MDVLGYVCVCSQEPFSLYLNFEPRAKDSEYVIAKTTPYIHLLVIFLKARLSPSILYLLKINYFRKTPYFSSKWPTGDPFFKTPEFPSVSVF